VKEVTRDKQTSERIARLGPRTVRDFIRTAALPPDWLEKAWRGAKRHGVDKLTSAEIDAEIAVYRCERKSALHPETK
jgi:hypothetical protein